MVFRGRSRNFGREVSRERLGAKINSRKIKHASIQTYIPNMMHMVNFDARFFGKRF